MLALGMPEDWQPPAFVGDFDASEVNLWLGRVREGRRPKESPTHYDPHDNLMLQLRGEKTFHMYHAMDAAALYPQYMRFRARSDPDDANSPELLSRYPKFGEIPEEEIMDVELGPDDSLFIPKGWWHRVVARTPSFSLNFWF